MRRIGWLALGLASALAPPAHADDAPALLDKRACIEAHTRMQREQMVGHLTAARAAAWSCARVACPAPLRGECSTWALDLDARVPTVVLRVHDAAGRSVAVSQVAIDGERVSTLPDVALPLDPGEHRVRVATAEGTLAEVSFTLAEGQARHLVDVALVPRTAQTPAPAPASAPAPPPPPPPPARFAHVPSLALGAASAAALGVFAYYGVAGREKQAALEASCAPACDRADVDAMRRDYLKADIALSAGAALALGALAWELWGVPARAAASATGVTVTLTGAF